MHCIEGIKFHMLVAHPHIPFPPHLVVNCRLVALRLAHCLLAMKVKDRLVRFVQEIHYWIHFEPLFS